MPANRNNNQPKPGNMVTNLFNRWLSKERTIAPANFNRWLVPPAALGVHLSIGMAYGFSVFWLPLSRLLGTACSAETSLWQELFVTNCDWKITSLGWIFTLFFIFLGLSAAVFGPWVEREGPRKTAFVATLCWGGGFFISALGIYLHQLWLMWLGSGVIGGIGLGLGYISPVSTLVKWFPDKRGMATGMAIMGFGGGAMIGSPLAVLLMNGFNKGAGGGLWQTFLVLGVIYSVFMLFGAFLYRVPPVGWQPKNTSHRPLQVNKMMVDGHVHVSVAWRTPQFWLIWLVLCMNVSAGIGILGMASPMLQEIFAGHLLGIDKTFSQLDPDELKKIAVIAGGFTGLLSLFNILGRFFWASLSDFIGRKLTYAIFFVLGIMLYYGTPSLAHGYQLPLFVLSFGIILSMYGGGFATVPAYLADMFGTQMVGAIHGRLLTAWATAGVLGPVVVNYIREGELARGVPREQLYDKTMLYLVGMLLIGFVANLLVRRVSADKMMTSTQLATLRASGMTKLVGLNGRGHMTDSKPVPAYYVVLAWLVVLIPLMWGFYITIQKSLALL